MRSGIYWSNQIKLLIPERVTMGMRGERNRVRHGCVDMNHPARQSLTSRARMLELDRTSLVILIQWPRSTSITHRAGNSRVAGLAAPLYHEDGDHDPPSLCQGGGLWSQSTLLAPRGRIVPTIRLFICLLVYYARMSFSYLSPWAPVHFPALRQALCHPRAASSLPTGRGSLRAKV